MDKSNIEFSVIATVYNNGKEVEAFLKNIIGQTIKPSEIIITDGGSTDETRDIIRKYAGSLSLPIHLVCDGRLNISQGINRAVEESKNELLFITAIGNEYADNFFSALLCTLQSKNADVVYCPLSGKDTTHFSFVYNEVFGFHGDGYRGAIASNHGVLIKKSVITEIGFFYENFVYAGEDTEFYSKVREQNYRCICTEDTKLYWVTPASIKEYCKQVNVYRIADLQMYSFLNVFLSCRNIFPLMICGLLIIMLLLIDTTRLVGVLLCIIGIIWFGTKMKKRGRDIALFFIISRVVPFFYFIKNIKYALPKYHIDESRRRKIV